MHFFTYFFQASMCAGVQKITTNTITDGGSTVTHLKAITVWGWMDWIPFRKLLLLARAAMQKGMDV